MSTFYCTHCGSRNHLARDCNKPHLTYVPKPGEFEPVVIQAPPPPEQPKPAPDRPVDPPRWPGGPPICTAENLPRFETEAELAKFADRLQSQFAKRGKWQCAKCGGWHYEAKPHGPSGSSGATERDDNLPSGFKPFKRPGGLLPSDLGDLPDRPVEEQAAAPKTIAKKPAAAHKRVAADGQGGLF